MLKKYEKQILEAYLNIPRFLHGERFKEDFVPFLDYELEVINPLIESNKDNDDGKELITAVLLTKAVCNIMNKYKK